jgi:hypothetical protein
MNVRDGPKNVPPLTSAPPSQTVVQRLHAIEAAMGMNEVGPVLTRVGELEKSLFGEVQTSPLLDRLATLEKQLGLSQT